MTTTAATPMAARTAGGLRGWLSVRHSLGSEVVAASLLRHGRRRLVRTLGALYPLFVLLVVVATGNHFFLDAAAGALVAGLAAAVAAILTRPAVTTRLTVLPTQRDAPPSFEELAA